ncbi:MAG: TIGR04283 family arsenosugar biosynthesis glycosyltransferase [Chthoniobacterales bacterium]
MVSIIIPTSNEAEFLPATLRAVTAAGVSVPSEVLVVDAGSSDQTSAVAEAGGARVLASHIRHRAAQMNLGAKEAQGEVLLFLHGDTVLPPTALRRIEGALANPCIVGGAFARRYDSPSAVLRATCLLAYLRGRMSGWFLGDQAIFVRAESFRALHGFRDFALFEDLDFARRLRAAGGTVILRPAVTSAARRFEARGPLRTTASDFLLTCRYLCGGSPRALARTSLRPPRTASVYEGT